MCRSPRARRPPRGRKVRVRCSCSVSPSIVCNEIDAYAEAIGLFLRMFRFVLAEPAIGVFEEGHAVTLEIVMKGAPQAAPHAKIGRAPLEAARLVGGAQAVV